MRCNPDLRNGELLNETPPPVGDNDIRDLKHLSFETRTAAGRKHFACKDRIVSQIFILPISNGVNILSIGIMVV